MGRILVSIALAVTALSAASCAPAGGPSSAPSVPPSGSAGTNEFADSLSFTPDETRSASATVTVTEGGTLVASAADGTTFELVVPAQAIAADTLITVTPLSGVQGMGEGPVHAVRFEPDGLELFEWARLTITPATPIPVAEQAMFEATTTGAEAQLALVDPAAADMVVLLEHFSVGGAASLSSSQRAAFVIKSATNAERRINGLIRDRLQVERTKQLTGTSDSDDMPDVSDLSAEYKREVLDKLRQAAELSCDSLMLYMRKAIGYERQLQLLGLSEAEEAESQARVVEAIAYAATRFEACEQQKIAECRAADDPSILIRFWLANERPADTGRAHDLCSAVDYRMDKTVTGAVGTVTWSVQYTGTKCAGPGGEWVIDSAGTLTGGGDTAQISGQISVQIDEQSGSGPLTGSAIFTDVDPGGGGQVTTGNFVGTGTFDEAGQKLDLTVTGGSGDGYIYGFLDTGITSPGTLSLPVEAGDFCS